MKFTSPHRWRVAVAVVGLAALLSTFPPGAASAAGNGEWSVTPSAASTNASRRSMFDLDVRPGETVHDAVDVTNTTDRYIRFSLFAADAYNTPNSGAFALRTIDAPGSDLAPWVRLPVSAFLAAPHSRTTIPFTVVVPGDASPGDHVGGIVALNQTPSTVNSGAVQLQVKEAVGVRMYVRVAGPRNPALVIHVLSGSAGVPLLDPVAGGGHATIAYEIDNAGNVAVPFTARLRITGLFGTTIVSVKPLVSDGLLPRQHLTVRQRVGLPLDALRVRVHLDVVGQGSSTSSSGSFFALPWLLPLMVVVLVVAFIWYRRRRRKRGPVGDEVPPDPAPSPVAVGSG